MTLKLQTISHRFGAVEAVRQASLEVAAGEIVSLFGPSGCGKTTLLRIVAGLEPLQAGTVSIDGRTIAEPGQETPPERRPVGFVFQDYALFPHMSVARNIAFGLRDGKNRKSQIADLLAGVDLAGLEKRYPHELSGGQQQRVALARALARRPRALLLDEPFASIDSVLRLRLREDLRRLLKDNDMAVLLVTHDPAEALALGDRIALMRAGRILEAATPAELFANPATADGASIFPDSQSMEGAVQGGRLHTAFGAFDAGAIKDGPVLAILRASALAAFADADGAARVIDTRFSGPHWTIFLKGASGERLLRATMATPPAIGTPMSLRIDAKGLFLFPAPH